MTNHNFGVWFNPDDEFVKNFANTISSWLKVQGFVVELFNDTNALSGFAPEVDMIISLGGDGTLLGLARLLGGKKIPLIGINCGHLGFLCVADITNWADVLLNIIKNQSMDSFSILTWQVERNKNRIAQGIAINDLVIGRGSLARVITLDMRINNSGPILLKGDGVLCCTPLGSSGYNSSAGGPFIEPTLPVFGVTPICPFNIFHNPLILNEKTALEFNIKNNLFECFLTLDGQTGFPLKDGDTIIIGSKPKSLFLPGFLDVYYQNLERRQNHR